MQNGTIALQADHFGTARQPATPFIIASQHKLIEVER